MMLIKTAWLETPFRHHLNKEWVVDPTGEIFDDRNEQHFTWPYSVGRIYDEMPLRAA